jgi:hypothetical protein
MSRCRQLLDTLTEDSPATHQVCDLGLVTIYLHRAWAHEIRGSGKVNEIVLSSLSFRFTSLVLLLP